MIVWEDSSLTDESCCDAEAQEGVRVYGAGPQYTKDNANDTDFSLFNTCFANLVKIKAVFFWIFFFLW